MADSQPSLGRNTWKTHRYRTKDPKSLFHTGLHKTVYCQSETASRAGFEDRLLTQAAVRQHKTPPDLCTTLS